MQDMEKTATVYLVDDDASIRTAMRRALVTEGFQVKCWANADAFMAEYDPAELGCLVTDVTMPGTDGLQLQSLLAERNQALPIIFISGHARIPASVQAMRAGAITFLQKPVRLTELVGAIREGIERNHDLRRAAAARNSVQARLSLLTSREREVMELVVLGKMNKQIAAQLGASEKTIKVHRGRVMKKMRARSVAELVSLSSLAHGAGLAGKSGLPR